MDVHKELYKDLDRASADRLTFTRRAFESLPGLDRPRILDAGCGNGDVTIELARLGGGEVFGIDIDAESIRRFEERINKEGLGERVHALRCSMLDMSFSPESFDLIWAEGSIHVIGFEKGLEALRRFIRPAGFLVVHEVAWIKPDPPAELQDLWKDRLPGIREIDEMIERIELHEYRLITHFILPENFWGKDYYDPLGKRIEHLREKYSDNTGTLAILDRERAEVDLYYQSSRWFGSAFFAMRRNDR